MGRCKGGPVGRLIRPSRRMRSAQYAETDLSRGWRRRGGVGGEGVEEERWSRRGGGGGRIDAMA